MGHLRRRTTKNTQPPPVRGGRRGASRFLCLPVLLLGIAACEPPAPEVAFPQGWPYPADESPTLARQGMVVSTDEYASDIGVRILQAGGNAVDAAVATSFALAVVNPEAGNIGGGGFMVIRLADGTTASLDYRERAPLGASRDMYLNQAGELTDASTLGHLAVGVPGTVAGLWAAHERFGALPWAELVAPSMELAAGFEVRERQARQLQMGEEDLRLYPATEAVFLPGGRPPEVGETFRQPELAATLGRIAAQGRDGFYLGRTADLIVEEMERGGGLITHRDLEEMEAAWRDPIEVVYRGHKIISMPPTSSGGATLGEMAMILEGFDLGSLGYHSAEHVHLLAEAWKRAYADRNTYLADPDFVEMPVEEMISPEYGARRRAEIAVDRATPSSEVIPGLGEVESGPGGSGRGDEGPGDRGPGLGEVESRPGEVALGVGELATGMGRVEHHETTHLSVVDGMGNAVSLTTTLNSFFGSKVTVAGAGFLLNNEMDDFSGRPGYPNQFGLVQGEANAIAPGKRMLSAMTPTIVEDPDGELLLVVGTPGGGTIITNVFQQISNVVDFGMDVRQAVNAPRLHHQHLPDILDYEPGALSPEVVSILEAMGQEMNERIRTGDVYPLIGDVQAIMRLRDGTLAGASDHRRGGAAVGY